MGSFVWTNSSDVAYQPAPLPRLSAEGFFKTHSLVHRFVNTSVRESTFPLPPPVVTSDPQSYVEEPNALFLKNIPF